MLRLVSILFSWIFAMALSALAGTACAQDYNWSQPFAAPLLLNPAEAGAEGGMRAALKYKKAWPEFSAPFKTVALGFDMALSGKSKNKNGRDNTWGFGISLLNDRAGDPQLTTNAAAVHAAYNLRINETGRIGAGFSVGYDQRSTNIEDGRWASQYNGYFYDPGIISGESFGQEREAHLEIGTGIRYQYLKQPDRTGGPIRLKVDAGLSGQHLGRIRMGKSDFLTGNMTPLFTGYVRSEFPIGKSTALTPAAAIFQAAGAFEIVAGGGVKQLLVYGESFIRQIHQSSAELALFYRVDRAFILQGQLNWGEYGLGLSYDLDVSDLEEYSSGRGGFELTFQWQPVKK